MPTTSILERSLRLQPEVLEPRRLLTEFNVQVLHQDVDGFIDKVEIGDRFGEVLTTGYFDADDLLDIAIGVPGEQLGRNVGAVSIVYGADQNLSDRNVLLRQSSLFGQGNAGGISSLSAGDFDGDGFDDLAIGSQRAKISSGAVAVIFGSADGLTTSRRQLWHQNVPGLEDSAEAGDRFGEAVVAGDFNDDRVHDLAIGVPGEDLDDANQVGAIAVLYGIRGVGLSSTDSQFLHQGTIKGDAAERNDQFGASLAVGDFNRDGNDDLSVGVPGEDIGDAIDAGAVAILYGNRRGFATDDSQFFHLDISGFESRAKSNDSFGFSLAAGGISGDEAADLAIGIPGKSVDGISAAGAVMVLQGSRQGLGAEGTASLLHQNLEGIEVAEPGDRFGSVLAVADLQPENHGDELIVGVPYEDVDGIVDAGVVHIIGTRPNSVWAFPNAQTIRASDVGMDRQSEANFGAAIAVEQHRRPRVWSVNTNRPSEAGDDSISMEVADLFIGVPSYNSSQASGGSVAGVFGGIDVTPPEVSVYVTEGQPDPIRNTMGICFDIEFSDAVTGFSGSDLQLSGMPGLIVKSILSEPNNVLFTALVTGMPMSGPVRARVPAGIASNRFGMPNLESNEAVANFVFVASVRSERLRDLESEDEILLGLRFNTPLIELAAGDIVLSGSAAPQSATVTQRTDSPGEFIVSIRGMTRDGNVVLEFHDDSWPAELRKQIRLNFRADRWTNPSNPFDVNGDGVVSARDVLLIINELNQRKNSDSTGSLIGGPGRDNFFDSNRDGYVSARDALLVINRLNGMEFER